MNVHLSPRGLIVLSLFIAFDQVFALPEVRTSPCPACHGKRSLALTPPNLGQFDGEIGVEPGKPFQTHRFDVRYDQCPLCDGTGRQERWTMARLPPPAGENLATCVNCLGTGISACQKCRRSGSVPCSKCRGAKKPGWLLSEEKTAGRTSRHKKKIVTPCSECKGLGKIVCPACEGRGGAVCKKCAGEGYVQKKERK